MPIFLSLNLSTLQLYVSRYLASWARVQPANIRKNVCVRVHYLGRWIVACS